MSVGKMMRTLAVLGLGCVLGSGLVIAPGERGAAETANRREEASRTATESAQEETIAGWKKGKGWGWIWGKDDEIGSLNALSNRSRSAALLLATRGEVFDLGLPYSRRSYKFSGHQSGRDHHVPQP